MRGSHARPRRDARPAIAQGANGASGPARAGLAERGAVTRTRERRAALREAPRTLQTSPVRLTRGCRQPD